MAVVLPVFNNEEKYNGRYENLFKCPEKVKFLQVIDEMTGELGTPKECYNFFCKDEEKIYIYSKGIKKVLKRKLPIVNNILEIDSQEILIEMMWSLEEELIQIGITEMLKNKEEKLEIEIDNTYKNINKINIRSLMGRYYKKLNSLSQLRLSFAKNFTSNKQLTAICLGLLDEYEFLEKTVGRYLFIGYVSTDCNYLRKYLWRINFKDYYDGKLRFRRLDTRKVLIFFDMKTLDFIVTSRKRKSHPQINIQSGFFDEYDDKQIEEMIRYTNDDFKKINIEMENPFKYSSGNTRVRNMNDFGKCLKDEYYCFSLKDFDIRYRNCVKMSVSDKQMCKESERFNLYPVNYNVLVYSIIRTWLHIYSRYFIHIKNYDLRKYNPVFKCEFDDDLKCLTNSFVRGKTKNGDKIKKILKIEIPKKSNGIMDKIKSFMP
jgi:hypothetical protein